ncbi:hypothetical protein SDC9_171446 [bioreactor metagenome]|uniref:Uncharacterized protein n=1 Tax=bioreactor metagenome TaxID=1076179 RepID=A0A645GDG8_9ZZZZ
MFPDKFQSILEVRMNSFITEGAGRLRQIFFADIYDHFINFHKIYTFNSFVSCQFTDCATITGANYKYLFDVRMNCHRHVDNHFMVDEFVFFCQHHKPVKSQKTAEFFGFKNIYSLKLALSTKKLFINFYGKLN